MAVKHLANSMALNAKLTLAIVIVIIQENKAVLVIHHQTHMSLLKKVTFWRALGRHFQPLAHLLIDYLSWLGEC